MEATLKIRAGYDIAFNCLQEVPMLLMLSVHPCRQQDLLTDHVIRFRRTSKHVISAMRSATPAPASSPLPDASKFATSS
jgi:hypothetical protein